MTPFIPSSSYPPSSRGNEGVALFNPLFDAPPDPPQISYQHSNSTDTSNSSLVQNGKEPKNTTNYYYSSQRSMVPEENMMKECFEDSYGVRFELIQREGKRNRYKAAACFFSAMWFFSWFQPRQDANSVLSSDDDKPNAKFNNAFRFASKTSTMEMDDSSQYSGGSSSQSTYLDSLPD